MSEIAKTIFIKTFGCAQNTADSERIRAFYWDQGYREVDDWKKAETVVINSCIVRESAENRVYGLIDKIRKNPSALRASPLDRGAKKIEIIVTGCLVGMYDKQNKIEKLKRRIPEVDRWLPIEKISFDWEPVRNKKGAALINISSGCNNFCSYCIVPYARGKEVSRPMEEILAEVDRAVDQGFKEVMLIGQNVNSYGCDLGTESVVHMGKKRIKSMFQVLLGEAAKKPLKKISFVSSNPWDFSDELIEVIAKNPNIDRLIHLPFQSGDDGILKKMNRSYTKKEYLELVTKIKNKIPDVRFSTDIIIGFPGETETAFENTIDVCQKVGFEIAYLNKYSPRKGTASAKLYPNDIPQSVKRERWNRLNDLVNKKII